MDILSTAHLAPPLNAAPRQRPRPATQLPCSRPGSCGWSQRPLPLEDVTFSSAPVFWAPKKYVLSRSGWWLRLKHQRFFLGIFKPRSLGRWSNLTSIFADGLKPPTRDVGWEPLPLSDFCDVFFGFYHLNLVEHESMKLHMIDDCLEVGCPLPPGLIAFNKYLMNADRFPYAKAMTAMHMAMTTFMSLLLYTCAPSLYPSMGKAKENWRTSISPREVVFFGGGKYPKNASHGSSTCKREVRMVEHSRSKQKPIEATKAPYLKWPTRSKSLSEAGDEKQYLSDQKDRVST